MESTTTRRELIAASVLAGFAAALSSEVGFASPLNPEQTIIKPPEALVWTRTRATRSAAAIPVI